METLSNIEILEKFNINFVWGFMFDQRNAKINESRFEFTFPLELMN